MSRENRKRELLFYGSFPTPVAACWRAFYRSRDLLEREACLCATVESLARYLTAVVLAETRPAGALSGDERALLGGAWVSDYVKLLEEQLRQTKDGALFVKPLRGRLLQGAGKATDTLKLLGRLARRCDEFLRGGGAEAPDAASVDELGAEVFRVLTAMEFLSEYPLGFFSRHGATGDRGGESGIFVGRFNRCMGWQRRLFSVPVDLPEPPPVGQMLLLSPELDRALCLRPYLMFGEGAGSHVLLFAGLYPDGRLRLAGCHGGPSLAVRADESPKTGKGEKPKIVVSLPRAGAECSARMKARGRLLPVGARLEGGLHNLGFLGRGAVGAVYRAAGEEESGPDRAAKVIFPDLAADPFFMEGVAGAFETFSRRNDPGLVPLTGFLWSAEHQQYHLFMEHMSGGSLEERLEATPAGLSVREVLELGIGVARGLEAVAASGWVHGSVHPGNVLFDDAGHVRLAPPAAAGLAVDDSRTLPAVDVLRHPEYAAPELLQGERHTLASDMYSLGALLHRAAAGRTPVKRGSANPAVGAGRLPPALESLLAACMYEDPSARPESFAKLAERLEAILGTEASAAGSNRASTCSLEMRDRTPGTRSEKLGAAARLEAEGELETAAGILEGLARETGDPTERAGLELRLSRLFLYRMNQEKKAAALLTALLERDPGETEAAALLEEHLRKQADSRLLCRFLTLRLTHGQPESRAGILAELSQLAQKATDDPEAASCALEAVFGLEPSFDLAVRIAELKQTFGIWQEARGWLARSLEQPADGQARMAVLIRLAKLEEERFGNRDDAILYWEQVLALEPGSALAVEALLRLYRLAFAYGKLLALLKTVAADARTATEDRVRHLAELGELMATYYCDPRAACEAFGQVLELDPGNVAALDRLSHIARREERWTEHYAYGLKLVELLGDGPEKSRRLEALAAVAEEQLGLPGEAAVLARRCLLLDPGSARAFQILKRALVAEGRHEEVAELLLNRMDMDMASADRVEVLAELKQLMLGVMKDPLSAMSVLQRMLIERPGDDGLFAELLDLARNTDGGQALLYEFLKERGAGLSGAISAVWLARALETGASLGRDSTELLELARKACERDPWNTGLLEQKARYARATGDWRLLCESMPDRLGPTADVNVQQAVVTELLDVLAANAAEPQDRVRILSSLLVRLSDGESTEEPSVPRATVTCELARALAALGRTAEAIRLLERVLYSLKSADVWLLMETLLLKQGEKERALELCRRAGLLLPDAEAGAGLLKRAAALARELGRSPGEQADLLLAAWNRNENDRELGLALADELQAAGRDRELTRVLETLAGTGTPEERGAVLWRLAALFKKRQATDSALSEMLRSFELAPQPEKLAEIENYATEQQTFGRLQEAWEAVLPSLEKEQRLETLEKMVTVAFRRQQLPQLGFSLYERFLKEAGPGFRIPDLRSYFADRADWLGLERFLEMSFRASNESLMESLGQELAVLRAKKLGLLAQAAETLEHLLEHNPESHRVAATLAMIYAAKELWQKAAPLFQMVPSLPADYDYSTEIEYRLAGAATFQAVFDRQQALQWYKIVLDLQRDHTLALKAAVRLSFLERNWDDLDRLLPQLLKAENLMPDEYREFSTIYDERARRAGTHEDRRKVLERMLAGAPFDREIIGRLMESCLEEQDFQSAIGYVEKLLVMESNPELRLALLMKKATAWSKIPEEGLLGELETLEQIVELRPEMLEVWSRIGELCVTLGEYEKALSALDRVMQASTDDVAASAAAYSGGLILADYLWRSEEAVNHLWRAFELDPGRLDAVARLEKLAADTGDPEKLRKLYVDVIAALETKGAAAATLRKYHLSLAVLAHDRLSDPALAEQQLRKVWDAARPDPEVGNRLAALLQSKGDLSGALQTLRASHGADPLSVWHLQELRKLFLTMKDMDKAWCTAGVLVAIGAATDKERLFYERLQSSALKMKPFSFTPALWTELLFREYEGDELSRMMRLLFERCTPEMLSGGRTDANPGVEASDQEPRFKVLLSTTGALARIFSVPVPRVYVRPGTGGVEKLPVWPASVEVSESVLEAGKGKELRFGLSRALALFRPECGLAGLMDREGLRNLLLNTVKLLEPSLPEPPGDFLANQRLRKQLSTVLAGNHLDELREGLSSLRRRGAELNLVRWLENVERCSCRAGFLLCNDFPVAARLIENRPVFFGRLEARDLVADLAGYAVSDAYFRLREKLGVSVAAG